MRKILKSFRSKWHSDISVESKENIEKLYDRVLSLENTVKNENRNIKKYLSEMKMNPFVLPNTPPPENINSYEKMMLIFNALSDDLSCQLFFARLKYNMSGNMGDIFKVLIKSHKEGKDNLISLLARNYPVKKDKLVLYGNGKIAKLLIDAFAALDISIDYLVKDEINGNEFKINYSYEIITLDELMNLSSDIKIIIGSHFQKSVKNFLISKSISPQRIYYYKYRLPGQYFDKGIFKPSENEVFIDGGSLNLGDSLRFINWANNSWDSIYAFEPDPKSYKRCLAVKKSEKLGKNVKCLNYGLWSENSVMSFSNSASGHSKLSGGNGEGLVKVNLTSIDKVMSGRKATFIKMDIEGSELKALKGAEQTIKKYKPKLAICIYHKGEDITEIPYYILSIVPSYKLFIRQYTTYRTETVLYCL